MPVWISASALTVILPFPGFFFFLLIQLLMVVLTQSHVVKQPYSLAGRLGFVNFWSAHLQVGGYSGVGAAVTGLR